MKKGNIKNSEGKEGAIEDSQQLVKHKDQHKTKEEPNELIEDKTEVKKQSKRIRKLAVESEEVKSSPEETHELREDKSEVKKKSKMIEKLAIESEEVKNSQGEEEEIEDSQHQLMKRKDQRKKKEEVNELREDKSEVKKKLKRTEKELESTKASSSKPEEKNIKKDGTVSLKSFTINIGRLQILNADGKVIIDSASDVKKTTEKEIEEELPVLFSKMETRSSKKAKEQEKMGSE